MLLYIIRHGDPDYATDTLLERGKLQAEAVGKRLAAAQIDRIFSSPMGRARQTAEPACRLLGLECEIEEWTREISEAVITHFPDGKPKSISAMPNTDFLTDGCWELDCRDSTKCPPIAESGMAEALLYLEENGNRFLEKLGYKAEDGVFRILQPNEDKVALFCHAAFTRAWLSILLRIPVHRMWANFSYTHTGVTVLEFKNNPSGITAPQILCYSDMSHLYAYGPDMSYRYTYTGRDL